MTCRIEPGFIAMIREEDRLDGLAEYLRDSKRQFKAGIVFAGFDGIDRLARDLEPLRQVGLRPIPFRAQHLEPVLHYSYLRLMINLAAVQTTIMKAAM